MWSEERGIEVEVKKSKYRFLVEYRYLPAEPGSNYTKHGDPGYPPEGAEVDLIAVKIAGLDILQVMAEDVVDEILDGIYRAEGERCDR